MRTPSSPSPPPPPIEKNSPSLYKYISERLYGSEMGMDVLFTVPISQQQQQQHHTSTATTTATNNSKCTVPAHKIILARSPVFRSWFFGENAHRFASQPNNTAPTPADPTDPFTVNSGATDVATTDDDNNADHNGSRHARVDSNSSNSSGDSGGDSCGGGGGGAAVRHDGADHHHQQQQHHHHHHLQEHWQHQQEYWQLKDNVLHIEENMSRDSLMEVLRWLYTDTVRLDEHTVIEVLHAARKYHLLSLEEECMRFLKEFISVENVFQLWEQARLFDRSDLEVRCVHFIEKNAEKLLADHVRSFCELSWEDVLYFVRNDFLVAEEWTIYQACMAWAEHACRRSGLDPTPEHKRQALGDSLFKEIRFTNMNPKQFSMQVIGDGILTKDEIIEVFTFWTLQDDENIQTPITFNTRQRHRREFSFLILGSGQSNKDIELVRDHVLEIVDSGEYGEVNIETYNSRSQTPALDELQQFNAVLVFSESRFADPVQLGNVLAEYCDRGGGVVVCTFSNCSNSLQLKGRLVEYLPVTIGSQRNLTSGIPHWAILSEGVTVDHPLLNGFRKLDCGKYRARCELKEYGECVARWEDNIPLISFSLKHRVVCLNFYPASSSVYTDCWNQETDGGTVLFNALLFVTEKD